MKKRKKYKVSKASPMGAFWKLWIRRPTKKGLRWVCVAIGNEKELRSIVTVLNGKK